MRPALSLAFLLASFALPAHAQIDQGQLGAWYSYAWTDTFADSRFGWQGDVQHRNWDLAGDLEQLLVRAGATWTPTNSKLRYTLGVAHIRSGTFGPSTTDSEERRLYQEASFAHTVGERWLFSHRFRLEQRWLDGQDQRNRLRYFVGLNVPLNQVRLTPGTIYVALANELFVNLENDIGHDRTVQYFDRNRFFAGVGYTATNALRFQFGYMHQETSTLGKGQLQINLIQSF